MATVHYFLPYIGMVCYIKTMSNSLPLEHELALVTCVINRMW